MLGGNLEETYTVTIWKKEIAQSRMGGRWSVFAAVTEIFDQLREFFARWLSTKHEPIPKQRKSIRQVTIIIMISELGVSENELNYQNEIAEKTPAVAIVWTKVIFFSIPFLTLSCLFQSPLQNFISLVLKIVFTSKIKNSDIPIKFQKKQVKLILSQLCQKKIIRQNEIFIKLVQAIPKTIICQ